MNTLRLFIVDIGGYTTDVLLLQNGKPNLQFCRSLEMGVITMNNEVIHKVNSQFDMLIDDEHIAAVFYTFLNVYQNLNSNFFRGTIRFLKSKVFLLYEGISPCPGP